MLPIPPDTADELTPALRRALHQEIHARPPQELRPPLAITHWAMAIHEHERGASREALAGLLARCGAAPPAADAVFVQADLGACSVRWELHTEFVVWTFFRSLAASDVAGFAAGAPPTAGAGLPPGWLQSLPGRALAGVRLWVLSESAHGAPDLLRQVFGTGALAGSRVVSRSTGLYTDFRMDPDGCVRMLVLAGDESTGLVTPRRLGRLAQRALEIETYRMAAMLAFPAARRVVHWLADAEAELAALAHAVGEAEHSDEPALLDRLTHLAARLEGLYAGTHTRFSASAAYHALMRQRLADIGEERIEGLQSLRDFLERRLTPAMATCRSADGRQAALSARIARIGNLLRTRVEVEQQRSSRALLATMNRRQGLQLKLQSTVEGLSVAAITYYVVGLIGHVAEGAQGWGWPVSAEATMALAVPLVALAVWWSLRSLHRSIERSEGHDGAARAPQREL